MKNHIFSIFILQIQFVSILEIMFWEISGFVMLFSMGLCVVNGRKSLWEVSDTCNGSASGSRCFGDDMWINLEDYPLAKSTLVYAEIWENGIVPYKLDDKYFEFDKQLIIQSMDEISKVSCIRFVKRTKEENYLYIKNLYNCASHIGFERNLKPQPLALSAKMCMNKGVIIHELMHALGFVHEHCRSDRESYINVDNTNVADIDWHNFEIYENGVLFYWSEKYDFDSIMHYDAYTYAIDKSKPVITSLVSGANLNIREVLSPADIRKLNKLYNC